MSQPIEPNHRSLPPVIVGASRAQDERGMGVGGKYTYRLPPQAELVVLDHYNPPTDLLVRQLVEAGQLTPGAVLVLSPFDTGTYAHASDAELTFEREKIQLISRLCQLLGATRVKSDTTTLRIDHDIAKGSAGFGKKIGRLTPYKAKADLTLDQREEWSQSLKVHDQYPGGEPAIAEARRFSEKHRIADPEVLGLIEARTGANTLRARRITVVYEGRQDRNLDIAADVGLPIGALTARGHRMRSTRRQLSLDLEITFD